MRHIFLGSLVRTVTLTSSEFWQQLLFWLHWYRWVFISILFSFQLFVQPYKFLINKTSEQQRQQQRPPQRHSPPREWIHNCWYLFVRHLSLYLVFYLWFSSKVSWHTTNLSTDIKVLFGIRAGEKLRDDEFSCGQYQFQANYMKFHGKQKSIKLKVKMCVAFSLNSMPLAVRCPFVFAHHTIQCVPGKVLA